MLDVGVNNGIPGVDPHKIVGDVEFEEVNEHERKLFFFKKEMTKNNH